MANHVLPIVRSTANEGLQVPDPLLGLRLVILSRFLKDRRASSTVQHLFRHLSHQLVKAV